MRMIDADALIERIDRLKHRIAGPAAGYVNEDSYECGAVDALTDAKNYAIEAPTVSGWISVKDRLPDNEHDVLTYLVDGYVTHWMPLPEPPKEENGNEDAQS